MFLSLTNKYINSIFYKIKGEHNVSYKPMTGREGELNLIEHNK